MNSKLHIYPGSRGDKNTTLPLIKENLGAGFSTVDNVQGIGNATPANTDNIGSGDSWDNSNKKTYKKKKDIKTNEEIINPYDTLGNELRKNLNVDSYFEKGDDNTVKQKNKFKLKTFDEFKNTNK
ncbi:MAG: hypothetical protein RSE41_09475 [Clostridia bacterium]